MSEPVTTPLAPPPAGAYSQAIRAGGFVFLAGQTPRLPDGTRIGDAPFEDQARRTLLNLEAVCRAAGVHLRDAVMVTVFLVDPANAPTFDRVWREFVVEPFPARAVVQSDLPGFALEVTAIVRPAPTPGARIPG